MANVLDTFSKIQMINKIFWSSWSILSLIIKNNSAFFGAWQKFWASFTNNWVIFEKSSGHLGPKCLLNGKLFSIFVVQQLFWLCSLKIGGFFYLLVTLVHRVTDNQI
jgi:hypothetical protein